MSHLPVASFVDSLAHRAKFLVEGMQDRVGRLPDVADFKAAFEDELRKGEHEDSDTGGTAYGFIAGAKASGKKG